MSPLLHTGTPVIQAPFRGLVFLRHPDTPAEPARVRVTRTVTDPVTRTAQTYGSRALVNPGTGNADAVTMTSLSGQPLMLHTADGDSSLTLTGAAGQPLWSRNAQGTVSVVTYETAGNGGRPVSLTETATGGAARIREQYEYASLTDAVAKAHNLAGALTAHHDNAGISRPLSVSMTGQPLQSDQRLLKPAITEPDWATLTAADTEASLTISGTYDATGTPLTQTNAAGVTTLTAYDISGAVKEARLQYEDKERIKEVITLKDIIRRADGVVLSQAVGNGITDSYKYDPQTQLLARHLTQRPADHALGPLLISDLHYDYDPAGNIISLEDKGTDPGWYNNQQATGLRKYGYDSLYRLVSAKGRERHPVNPDDLTAGYIWSPYTERYTYDDGNNLTEISHAGGSGNRTVTMTVSESSNRAVVKNSGTTPDTGFLAGGLQKALSDGRQLSWQADSQIRQVSPVTRDSAEDDTERYHYADGGTRIRKIRTTQTSGGIQETLTTYAGGTETRRRSLVDQPQRDIVITEGGGVRLIEDRLTGEIHLRYGFSGHLSSSGGETDGEGRLTSREEYLPYGGIAGSVEEAEEIHDRTYRYSGKERDATGLLYYGWRYYQPETGRWLSADPGGLVDGVNLFQFCRNSPVNIVDGHGFVGEHWQTLRDNVLVTQHSRRQTVYPPRHVSYQFEQFKYPESVAEGSRSWRGVQYWNAEQRQMRRIFGNNGRLVQGNDVPVNSYGGDSRVAILSHTENWQNNQLGYVLGKGEDGQKELILFKHTVDYIHHSTPFSGRGVLDAGMMSVAHGHVAYIENKSGHYRPNIEQKMHTLNYLKEQGLSLDDVFLSERAPMPEDKDFGTFMNRNLYQANDFINYYEDRKNKPRVRNRDWQALPPSIGEISLKLLPETDDTLGMKERIENATIEPELAAMTARKWYNRAGAAPGRIVPLKTAYTPFAERTSFLQKMWNRFVH